MRILYINLDSDTTSRDLTEAELARVGLKAERVSAVCEDNRPLAFNKSVYKAMEMAKGEDLLLMEDDVMFDAPITIFSKAGAMSIHYGANIIGMDTTVWQMPTPCTKHVARLWNCWMSHCTFYSAECVQYILDNFKYVTDEYKTEGCIIFDEWFRLNVLPMGRSYVTIPMVAYQRPRHSAIWNTVSDYTSVHKRGNEYLNRL